MKSVNIKIIKKTENKKYKDEVGAYKNSNI